MVMRCLFEPCDLRQQQAEGSETGSSDRAWPGGEAEQSSFESSQRVAVVPCSFRLWKRPLETPQNHSKIRCPRQDGRFRQVNREQKLGARVVPSKVWHPGLRTDLIGCLRS